MSDSLNNVKQNVYQVNSDLQNSHLVIQNFGNASSRFLEGFVIKPSGIILSESNYKEMVQMDLNGNKIDGKLNPSSDEPIIVLGLITAYFSSFIYFARFFSVSIFVSA